MAVILNIAPIWKKRKCSLLRLDSPNSLILIRRSKQDEMAMFDYVYRDRN